MLPYLLVSILLGFGVFEVLIMSRPVQLPAAQMLIYSGRPDPQWNMSVDHWDQLNELVDALPGRVEHQGTFDEPSLLGYRGFQSEWNDHKIFYVAQTKQAVKVQVGSYTVYEDSSNSIEQWFVKNAKEDGDLDLQIPTF